MPRSDYEAHGKSKEPNLTVDEKIEYSFEHTEGVSRVIRIENGKSDPILELGKGFWGSQSFFSSGRKFQFRDIRNSTEKAIVIAFLADNVIDYSG